MLRTTQIGCRAFVVKHKFQTHKNIEQVMDYLEVNKCNGYNCFIWRFHAAPICPKAAPRDPPRATKRAPKSPDK